MFVKVCGLTTMDAVQAAVDAGADAVGFVLTVSPRRVAASEVRRLVELVPPTVLTVAVFRAEPAPVVRREVIAAGVRAVQLHGTPTAADFDALRDLPVTRVRATSVEHTDELACGALGEDLLILDSPKPGSGQGWDLSSLRPAGPGSTGRPGPTGRWMLAGGLHPGNVAAAVAAVAPWGVDVSSGVEVRRGVKDPRLIAEFVAAARSAQAAQDRRDAQDAQDVETTG